MGADQEQFELRVTAESVVSTDERFSIDDIGLGDNYKPCKVYFKKATGEVVERTLSKGEKKISNRTMPSLACQVFEEQLDTLSVEDKLNFPICRYTPDRDIIRGIHTSQDKFANYHGKTYERLTYNYDNGRQFVLYCWNIFSTIFFVQECLKRFGKPEDQFVLIYQQKDKEKPEPSQFSNRFSSMLLESKNLIFSGAPSTGKSYLAKKIAADIISNGRVDDYALLNDEQKQQVEFVQFHPSYDYSDFVEGLRPKVNDDGTMGFELRDGIFKKFVARARKNYENSQKSSETLTRELTAQESMAAFFSDVEFGVASFKLVNGNEFIITNVDDAHINVSIPNNPKIKNLTLDLDEVRAMLESGQKFERVKDVTDFFKKTYTTQQHSYDFAIYNAIKAKQHDVTPTIQAKQEELKPYVFLIDEINRGEISKIFGELFFCIDPGYRGKAGEISTQYSNLHSNPDNKFYIPQNVYIIGTMNDIDRSVDSFDFAMRRRFRFVKLRADDKESLEMLSKLKDKELQDTAIRRMRALNEAISDVEDLNENYHIGASYFLKLTTLDGDDDERFDQLWTDYLQPLLQEYIQGMYDEDEIMNRLANAYGYQQHA